MSGRSVLGIVVEALPACVDSDGEVLSEPFLAACRLVLPVIDKLGAAFMPARADVSGNIERLATRCRENPDESRRLFDVIRAEVKAGAHGGNTSCTKGLLWLKRFLEFVNALLRRLAEDPAEELGAAARAAYQTTLYPFHGYLSSSVFSLVLRAAPYRSTFVAALLPEEPAAKDTGDIPAPAGEAVGAGAAGGEAAGGTGERIVAEDIAAFGRDFAPLLARVHDFLDKNGLDDPTPV